MWLDFDWEITGGCMLAGGTAAAVTFWLGCWKEFIRFLSCRELLIPWVGVSLYLFFAFRPKGLMVTEGPINRCSVPQNALPLSVNAGVFANTYSIVVRPCRLRHRKSCVWWPRKYVSEQYEECTQAVVRKKRFKVTSRLNFLVRFFFIPFLTVFTASVNAMMHSSKITQFFKKVPPKDSGNAARETSGANVTTDSTPSPSVDHNSFEVELSPSRSTLPPPTLDKRHAARAILIESETSEDERKLVSFLYLFPWNNYRAFATINMDNPLLLSSQGVKEGIKRTHVALKQLSLMKKLIVIQVWRIWAFDHHKKGEDWYWMMTTRKHRLAMLKPLTKQLRKPKIDCHRKRIRSQKASQKVKVRVTMRRKQSWKQSDLLI